MRLEPIVTSLLDTDLYKFNMDQVIFHKHTNLSGEYDFLCRNEGVVFTPEMLDNICDYCSFHSIVLAIILVEWAEVNCQRFQLLLRKVHIFKEFQKFFLARLAHREAV